VVASSLSALVGLLVVLGVRIRRSGWSAVAPRSLVGLAGAGVAGVGLAAPLVLPGLQLAQLAIRSSTTPDRALSPHLLANLLLVGYDGLPFGGSPFWGTMFLGSAMWVGPIVLVLAVVGLVQGRRRPAVLALGAVAALDLLVLFVPAVIAGLVALPAVGSVMWRWSTLPLMLALALLAGTGADELLAPAGRQAARRVAWAGATVAAVVLGLLWLLGRSGLRPAEASVRTHSFGWPLLGLAALAVVLGLLALADARPRPGLRSGAIAGLMVAEVALLVSAGAPLWRSELTHPPHPPAVAALRSTVGGATVGFGAKSCFIPPTLGIQEQANVLYGVHELDAYDPMTPTALFDAWILASGGTSPGTYVPPSQFCPAVTDARIARRFGVRFILVAHGAAAPFGTALVRQVGDEDLYRVPGAAAAVVVDRAMAHDADAVGTPARLQRPTPSTALVALSATRASVLRLHLERVPGWTATLDGRPLALRPYSIAMLQADVPAGHHVLRLRYRPAALEVGAVVAMVTIVAMGVAGLVALGRRRRPAPSGGDAQA